MIRTLLLITCLCACGSNPTPLTDDMSLTLTSTAFTDETSMPLETGCKGAGTSPPLAWSGGTGNIAAWALLVEDFDVAPAFGGPILHWGIWNIPAETRALDAAQGTDATLASGARQATNSHKTVGYSGPCPPIGSTHHYRFRIYGLDAPVDVAAAATRDTLLEGLKPHAIAGGELVGLYGR